MSQDTRTPAALLPRMAQAHALASAYAANAASRPVGATMARDELRALVAVPLTDAGTPEADVVATLAHAAEAGTVASISPRYFGFVIGGSHPVALAADWL